ncbi:hypothetical protein [Aliiruegeria lutimaris]|uniref:hypothetical protein n=1 Tax=Aliiruegeria lutimaris TaxID=571298 RepID=UPI000B880D27|nr:hypothetical protein [Aliiruegeria lutimaris]
MAIKERTFAAPHIKGDSPDFPDLQPNGPNERERHKADEVDGSCSTGIERAKVQLSSTARKGAIQ